MPKRHPWTGFRSAPPPKTPVSLRPRPDRFIEIGKVFGRLTCISETDEAEFWLFRCTCGKRVKTTARHLRDGKPRSSDPARSITVRSYQVWPVMSTILGGGRRDHAQDR